VGGEIQPLTCGKRGYTDFSRLVYLDKETRTLGGVRRTGDLLVKVRFKGQEAAFLIHVEHEARKDRDIAWRLLEYVVLDRRESGLPVYPVLVLAGPTGPAPQRPVRIEFPDRCVLTFDFPVIELAKLEARDYVRKENAAASALAARMKFRQEEQEDLILDFAAGHYDEPSQAARDDKIHRSHLEVGIGPRLYILLYLANSSRMTIRSVSFNDSRADSTCSRSVRLISVW